MYRFRNKQTLLTNRYCECFSSGTYCDGCNCLNCHNNIEHESDRKDVMDVIKERNPEAFKPKIANSPHKARDSMVCNLSPQFMKHFFVCMNLNSYGLHIIPYVALNLFAKTK